MWTGAFGCCSVGLNSLMFAGLTFPSVPGALASLSVPAAAAGRLAFTGLGASVHTVLLVSNLNPEVCMSGVVVTPEHQPLQWGSSISLPHIQSSGCPTVHAKFT